MIVENPGRLNARQVRQPRPFARQIPLLQPAAEFDFRVFDAEVAGGAAAGVDSWSGAYRAYSISITPMKTRKGGITSRMPVRFCS
jgi:hypothetical protein